MDNKDNISYFFIPFAYENQRNYKSFIKAFNNGEHWNIVHDEIRYMFKYVADKINSYDEEKCQCFHYELTDKAREKYGIANEDEWFYTEPHKFNNEINPLRFQIKEVQLFCFSTTVCIIAIKLHFEDSDPFAIANAQYYLKKTGVEKIFSDNNSKGFTFIELSKKIMEPYEAVSPLDFFFYANESTERSNVFTFISVEEKENYDKELYYLRRCYSDGFLYDPDVQLDDETYSPSSDIVWGISAEAAVCLGCPHKNRADFVLGTFYNNFNKQYLFMYVLLLHQRYVLYLFLTKIGIGTYNELETLEQYKSDLYEFETDFVFSCVTEVPQYQILYNKISKALLLKDMYEDVREPLRELSEARRTADDKMAKKHDDNVNRALLALSILSFFSALIDSFDFVKSFGSWFMSDVVVKIVQGFFIIVIFAVLIYAVSNLLKKEK